MLNTLNDQAVIPPASLGIHSLVELQAERTPDVIAAVLEDRTITYSQLNERASQLAHRLIQRGVGSDRVVGIALERSIEMVVALLAVLKAGGAYIWLDPTYPRARLAFMIEDAQPVVVITNSHLLDHLPAGLGQRSLCLDEQAKSLSEESGENPATNGDPDDLAYVIYTSGSTGQPKGVAMSRRALSCLLEWQLQHWTPPAAARTLQFTSLNFDVSFQEIFSTLCAGGTLVLTSEKTRRDPSALLRLMRDSRVERIFLPFVALQQLAKAFEAEPIIPANLRDVITAGEQLQITPQIRMLFEKLGDCALHNQYGPAESHIIVTAFTLRGQPDTWPLLPPIGKPIARARIHILDEQKRPVTEGAAGEIHIGGAALARGYLNREELTAERFVRDPFSDDAHARLYRTGDLGRFLADGNIQFLGRSDQQVKIRGVRVELGEVEAVMAQHPAVREAVVCAKEVAVGDKRLIAYLVPKTASPPKRDDLRGFLEARLPAQFIPSVFVLMTEILLTTTGKVDRLALTSLADDSVRTLYDVELGDPKLPADEIQARLVAIWEDLLNKRPISVQANFFDLGGDSLLAVQLCAEIARIFDRTVSVAALFNAPTIEELSALIAEDRPNAPISGIEAIRATGSQAPLFCVPALLDLARELGSHQSVYGFDLSVVLSAVEKMDDPKTVVPQIAARWVEEISKVQPHGPYYLAGHSFGGVVAFEAASRLVARGERVALLAMLDPDPPKPSREASIKWISTLPLRILRRMLEVPPAERMAYLLRRAKLGKAHFACKLRALNRFADLEPLSKLDALVGTYPATKYPGRITLFCARDTEKGFGTVPALHWKAAAGEEIDIHQVPGDHMSILRKPNVKTLARLLRSCIKSAALVYAFAALIKLKSAITVSIPDIC